MDFDGGEKVTYHLAVLEKRLKHPENIVHQLEEMKLRNLELQRQMAEMLKQQFEKEKALTKIFKYSAICHTMADALPPFLAFILCLAMIS